MIINTTFHGARHFEVLVKPSNRTLVSPLDSHDRAGDALVAPPAHIGPFRRPGYKKPLAYDILIVILRSTSQPGLTDASTGTAPSARSSRS